MQEQISTLPITIKSLCVQLKISRATVYRYMRKGMPHKYFGRMLAFDIAECKKWIENKEIIL